MLQFVVGTDGSVSGVKVLHGVNPLLDAEAVRVISSSPNWTPGELNGEIIAVSEAYKAKDGCLKGIESVKDNSAWSDVVEE